MTDFTERVLQARSRFEAMCAKPVSLDITRGKPSAQQLDLSLDLLTVLGPDDFKDGRGHDCRNYGVPDGLPEVRALFGELLDLPTDGVVLGDNSSLSLMADALSAAVLHGVPGGSGPWRDSNAYLLCPVPGYDRHFGLTDHLGVGMTNIDIGIGGLDIESVERLAASDERIKGIWLVPKYQNPVGYTLTLEEVRALAAMKTAAPDFRILWDNAYVVHHIDEVLDPVANVLQACEEAGNPDRVWVFGSTSKVTFAGAGVSAFGGSPANVAWFRKHRGVRTIGPDKINQLRHLRFFGDADGVRSHMKRHASLLRPQFEVVQRVLETHLGGGDFAHWTQPRGGYFVSLDTRPGRARRVFDAAARAGVALTPVGATFPRGNDPEDRNIRIAPTMPPLRELEQAIEILATAILCECSD
ncbi:MAG: aminotransferase class I/II-fold pyridoxal phosphate-dependent enzyme [Myxococcota bacterium]|nr:aminotransferase class I/II-fold pyridoxal phosphate-dependent enzyme [Myxococcota bacterium]